MLPDIYTEVPAFRSRLSFLPLVKAWEQIAAGEDRSAKICADLVMRFSQHAELLEPIDEYGLLDNHQQLIEDAMRTIFPVSLNLQKQLNAIATPFSRKVIHASPYFRNSFMDEKHNYVLPLDRQVENNITRARVDLAYKMILKKFFNINLKDGYSFICAYPDPEQDIHNYFELTWDPEFIDVSACIDLPSLPENFADTCYSINDLVNFPGLRNILPLEQFIFDGILIINIKEVTAREATRKIKDIFQNDNVLVNHSLYSSFKEQLKFILQKEKIELGITAFRTTDGGSINILQHTSIILKNSRTNESIDFLLSQFSRSPYYVARVTKAGISNPVSAYLMNSGWKTALFCSVSNNGEIIGFIEIYLNDIDLNEHALLAELHPIMPLIQSALLKHHNHLQDQINRMVKDHFTAVHSSVEWKFNETAINYLMKIGNGEAAKMDPILFNEVYPLFGTIDIRNSSLERNHAIQKDILNQMQWVKLIFLKAQEQCTFPLLDEIQSQLEEYILSVNNFLFSPDEEEIYSFLKIEVTAMLHHLCEIIPDVRQEISKYFDALDKRMLTLNSYQKMFDETVTSINDYISDFLEKEQADAQAIYPHYFERFVTDGAEFNLYIGQSIAPAKKFNILYLKNLRLWQLKIMAMAAQQLHVLSAKLPLALETTQLILVNNYPISISFRTAERKFDVDGVYNARYEVVKKRIDKVHIRNTNERLTRSGSIAIVYYNEREAREYQRYINFLKKQKLLEGEVEKLELEELQGVSGLKALRINIMKQDEKEIKKQKNLKQKQNN